MISRSEKLSEARRLLTRALTSCATIGTWQDLIGAVGLALDLIESEKEEKPTGRESSIRDASLPAPDFAAMASELDVLWSLEELEAWLRANWPKPAPAGAPVDAPDFAAMAMQVIGGWTTLGKPCSLDHRYTVSGMDVATALRSWWPDWIRANCPKPAPAGVRDEAWWRGVKPELYYPPPAPAPAFDVEALIKRVSKALLEDGWSDMQVEMICSTLRAVAREMRKEGVR